MGIPTNYYHQPSGAEGKVKAKRRIQPFGDAQILGIQLPDSWRMRSKRREQEEEIVHW